MRFFATRPSDHQSDQWSSLVLRVLGVLSISLAIWFGFLWTGLNTLTSPWVRGGIIALILALVVLGARYRYQKRCAAAKALENTLLKTPIGDGAVLAQRMQDAVATLKNKGGPTALDDLPWYIIIGPPGAGKTTALVNSGLEFPGADKAAVAGFGGTKNCDFWFTQDAVLIDTAGRYTTQDSDECADQTSWQAFLDQLKRARPKQPINGVILAFSCDDIMTASPADLDAHARAIRRRLEEIHDKLLIDVPVYVMFTKADMIVGFREFFSPFPEDRRRRVWGVTFQTKNRKDETYRLVVTEFDALISRLSRAVTDRLQDETDSVARIATFEFPSQMAQMQHNVVAFLRRVFQPSQDNHAVLRGFYFTSGTQDGTPIDQVLGTLAGEGGYSTKFTSGKGRSYFLQDLLQQVIFAERDWVGYSRLAVIWRTGMRAGAMTAIVAVTVLALGLFGTRFWDNATLVRQAGQGAQLYQAEVQSNPHLQQTSLKDPNPFVVMDALAILRDIPTGWGDVRAQGLTAQKGVSRRASLGRSALVAYSDALERHLRPRLMLQLENALQDHIRRHDIGATFRTLKVYFEVAKQQPGKPDDSAVQRYFATAWQAYTGGDATVQVRAEMNDHLSAMLTLDSKVTPKVTPNRALVETAQQMIATLSPAQRVYASIRAEAADMTPYRLAGGFKGIAADLVIRPNDGQGLDTLEVPGLYAFSGYWSVFRPALERAKQRLTAESWLFGPVDTPASNQPEIGRLSQDVHALYQADFIGYWDAMLGRIQFGALSTGAPDFAALTLASAPSASPILWLAEAVEQQTHLSRALDRADLLDTPAGPRATLQGEDEFSNIDRSRRAFQRRQLDGIERHFEKWHQFVEADATAADARPVDVLLAGLRAVGDYQQAAVRNKTLAVDTGGLQDGMTLVTQNLRLYPDTMVRFVTQVDQEFRLIWATAMIQQMQAALTKDVTGFCRQNIETVFPFAPEGPPVSAEVFGEFFGKGGRMELFYQSHLSAYIQRSDDGGLVARQGSTLGARLAPSLLDQFARADRIRQGFYSGDAAQQFSGGHLVSLTEAETVATPILMQDLRAFQCPQNLE